MVKLNVKKIIALAVLAVSFGLPIFNQQTSVAFADGMAYRERQDNDYITQAEEDRYEARWKNLSKAQKKAYVKKLRGMTGGKEELAKEETRVHPWGYWLDRVDIGENDDPNGEKAFNRTHGRGNEDGSDGMAWRERQDNNNGVRHDRRPRTANSSDENGMDAFNRTHGR